MMIAETEENGMDYRMKYMMNEGLMLLSYAYAVSGYFPAAAVLGFFSLGLAVFWHSGKCFLNNLPGIAAGTMIQLPFILLSMVPGTGYVIALLAFCNAAVSSLWMSSSCKAVRPTVRILMTGLPLFLILSLILPESSFVFACGTSDPRLTSVMLDLLIFLPVLGCYMRKILGYRSIFLSERKNLYYN